MKKPGFVHLHNHSEYSLFDGLLRFSDNGGQPSAFLRDLAKQKGAAMAVTDHGNMYGAMEFYFNALELGIKPIIGCEVYVQRTPITDKSEGSHKGAGHLTLLASNLEGYANLCRIVSKSFLEGFNHGPKVDLELLAAHGKGIICLSGCIAGQVARACSHGRADEALVLAKRHADIFGKGNFYIELMDNGMPEQATAMKILLEVSKKLKLPVVATNDCHYWKPEDWEAQDAKLCLRTNSLIGAADRFRFTGREYYFKSPEAMAKLFKHTPEAVKNTVAIADRCNVKLPAGEPRLPALKGGNADAQLKTLCVKGLAGRLGKPDAEHKKRLEWELKTVKDSGLSGCFLVIADLVKNLRAKDVAVGPGRGSVPGALINYALGVTGIDPLPAGLMFERFLNKEAFSMPALDIDLEDGGWDKAVECLRKKYGAESVAGVITYNRCNSRNLVWDIGTALGMGKDVISNIQRLIPWDAGRDVDILNLPGIKQLCADAKIKKLIELARGLNGIVLQTGIHNSGVLVTPGPASGFVPLNNTNRKHAVTAQYDRQALMKLGFMKLDLMSLRTLGITRAAVDNIKKRGFDLERIPLDDMKTWTLIAHGLTTGILQLESEGFKKFLVELRPGRLEDLAALIALYRPATIQGGVLGDFIGRKTGVKPITYPHPALEPLLKETYGSLIYQEQLMGIVKDLAGFTPWQANAMCRDLGTKRQPGTDESRKLFIAGAKKKKISPKDAAELFAYMVQAAGYCYTKAHSLPSALISYRSAYLKANYPQQYMPALLESERAQGPEHNNYNQYLAEARSIGVKDPV